MSVDGGSEASCKIWTNCRALSHPKKFHLFFFRKIIDSLRYSFFLFFNDIKWNHINISIENGLHFPSTFINKSRCRSIDSDNFHLITRSKTIYVIIIGDNCHWWWGFAFGDWLWMLLKFYVLLIGKEASIML